MMELRTKWTTDRSRNTSKKKNFIHNTYYIRLLETYHWKKKKVILFNYDRTDPKPVTNFSKGEVKISRDKTKDTLQVFFTFVISLKKNKKPFVKISKFLKS